MTGTDAEWLPGPLCPLKGCFPQHKGQSDLSRKQAPTRLLCVGGPGGTEPGPGSSSPPLRPPPVPLALTSVALCSVFLVHSCMGTRFLAGLGRHRTATTTPTRLLVNLLPPGRADPGQPGVTV